MVDEVTTLVDTNVLLDVLTDDDRWAEWSSAALSRAIDRGPTVINPLVYAELSVRFVSEELVNQALEPLGLQRHPLPYEAAFPAAKAFVEYRRRGGSRSAVLPDFYIGAHALVSGHTLLTRDARRYTTSFPGLVVVAP